MHKNDCHPVFPISAAAAGLLLLALLALLRRGGGLGQGRADSGAGHHKALASHVRHVVGCLQLNASSFRHGATKARRSVRLYGVIVH